MSSQTWLTLFQNWPTLVPLNEKSLKKFKQLASSHLPAKSTMLIRDFFSISLPAAFFDFWVNLNRDIFNKYSEYFLIFSITPPDADNCVSPGWGGVHVGACHCSVYLEGCYLLSCYCYCLILLLLLSLFMLVLATVWFTLNIIVRQVKRQGKDYLFFRLSQFKPVIF